MNVLSRIFKYLQLGSKPLASHPRQEVQPRRETNQLAVKSTPLNSFRPSARAERTLLIGVDFGTNSTKVIWQDLSNNAFEVFRWLPHANGVASMLLPSTVTIRQGSLYFGISEHDVCRGDQWLHSIK